LTIEASITSALRDPVGVDHEQSDHECQTKLQKIPEILTVDELVKLLDAIPEPFRTVVFLDGASGLRVGELSGILLAADDADRQLDILASTIGTTQ
jgi:integrase